MCPFVLGRWLMNAGKNKTLRSLQPLNSLQANGPGLRYKVMWRQKARDLDWTSVTVANNSKFVVSGTPTFALYELKVQAVNDHGVGPEPRVAHGYSGEDCEFFKTLTHTKTGSLG